MPVAAPFVGSDAVMATYPRWPVEFQAGRGATLIDSTGREFIDLVAGIAVATVGHAHPRVATAIAEQASRLVHVSNLYWTEPQVQLAVALAEISGGKQSFFANSGAEAIECALKLVRKWGSLQQPRRWRVITATGSFHGRTFGAIAATGQPSKRAVFEPVVPGFDHVTYGDAAAIASALDDDVAAVLLEPIQGEAGVVVPPAGYLHDVRRLCNRAGVLLVLDEIQTGVGRTGRWFCHEHEGVDPDVVCLAKAIAGGLPMGVCLAKPDVAATFTVGDHATTFGGGPVQSAAALAVLDVIREERLLERATIVGTRLSRGLAEVFGDAALVRGRGLLIGVEFGQPLARPLARAAFDRGVLVNDATPTVLRMTPPLVIGNEEIDRALETLAEVWHETGTA